MSTPSTTSSSFLGQDFDVCLLWMMTKPPVPVPALVMTRRRRWLLLTMVERTMLPLYQLGSRHPSVTRQWCPPKLCLETPISESVVTPIHNHSYRYLERPPLGLLDYQSLGRTSKTVKFIKDQQSLRESCHSFVCAGMIDEIK